VNWRPPSFVSAREQVNGFSIEFDFRTNLLAKVVVENGAGTQTLIRDETRIACDFEGPVTGGEATQLLLLVNGFARPRADFRAFRKRIHTQMPTLATVALDNRGAGETVGGLEDLSVQSMALDAAFVAQSFAAALKLPQYAILGISMGGMIAQCWAAQDAHVARLVLVSTTAGGPARVWPDGIDPEEARRKAFEPWPEDPALMHRRMSRYFGPKFRKSSPLLIEMMVKNMLKSQTERGAEGRSKAQYNATIGFDGIEFARGIQSPVLVLSGTDDEIIPSENSKEICRLIPQAQLRLFDGMGHLLLIEDPENFVAEVRSFLEGPSRRGRVPDETSICT